MTKPTSPIPSLSLKTLAQFLAPYPRNSKVWEQGKLELCEPLEVWDRRIRADIETPKTCEFRQRYEDFYDWYKRQNSRSVSAMTLPNWVLTPSDAFIWTEFQAFIDQADERGRERKCIIGSLKDATPEDIERIYELCFIPTVVFPCVLEIAAQYECLHKKAQEEEKCLKGLISVLESNYHLASNPLKTQLRHCADRAQKELELIEHVFEVKYPARNDLDAWREHFGIDKGSDIAPQKHRIWKYICKDLVGCIKPYCDVRKKNTKRPMEVPTDARDTAARLLHLSAPNLWPDGPKGRRAVENWYWAAIRDKKKYASPIEPASAC